MTLHTETFRQSERQKIKLNITRRTRSIKTNQNLKINSQSEMLKINEDDQINQTRWKHSDCSVMTTFSKQLISNQWSIDYRSIWDVLLSSIWTNIDLTVPWAFARWGGSTWQTVTLSCDLPVDQSKIFCRACSVCLRQRCGSPLCRRGFKGSSVQQTLTLVWISLYLFNLVFYEGNDSFICCQI